jgi:hypothetical protein
MRPEAISKVVRPLFESTKPIVLAFGETVELGPKRLLVHMVNQPKESELHNQLREVLDAVNVEYQYPQFIGDNHKAHVTYREGVRFSAGDTHISPAVYLVEVVEGDRVIRARYPLNG